MFVIFSARLTLPWISAWVKKKFKFGEEKLIS